MNEEIKKILELFSSTDKNIMFGDIVELNSKESHLLLNYITNLQQENERLKEENKRIFSKVNDDELLISNAMNYAEAQDYKSRCEKAIELINAWLDGLNNDDIIILLNDLGNILKGGDK